MVRDGSAGRKAIRGQTMAREKSNRPQQAWTKPLPSAPTLIRLRQREDQAHLPSKKELGNIAKSPSKV